MLVHEGPEGVRELIRMGAQFDQENGEFALTKEGAHSQRRILHANGDATGFEIVRALPEKRWPIRTLKCGTIILSSI